MPKIKKWNDSDIIKLKCWYKFIGDKEISIMLNELNNYNKFTKKSIEKKRFYLKLKRTKIEVSRIMSDSSIIPKMKEGDMSIVNDHKFIKINNKIISYSRWHYSQHYDIPDGMTIFYKDFDTLNDDITNLEVRRKSFISLKDYKKGLRLIIKNIQIKTDYNLANWGKMTLKERAIHSINLGRMIKIKDRLYKKINKDKLNESKFYEPMASF